MKKRNAIAIAIAITATAAMALAQTKAIDKHGEMLFEGRPFFTDGSLYNSYDLGGSPLGLFDIGSPRFSVEGGYRRTGFGDGAGSYLSGQSFLMGDPGRAFFQVFYGPDILSHKNGGNAVSLPLHRFGLALAAQGTSQAFRSSLIADGYYGKQGWENGDSARVLMGFERLRFDLGSRPHPLLRVGLFFGVTGGIDTLYTPNNVHEDRSAQMNLPEFGANFDFGGEDMPLARSNLTFSYAFSRFVYTSKPIVPGNGNADAIVNDSFNLFWVTRGLIPVGGDSCLFLKPGLLVGFTGNSGEMRAPHPDNDIIQLGDARPNSPYGLTGFWFGIGTGFEVPAFGEAYAEYALADMSLERNGNPSVDKSRTLHHVSFGVSTRMHEYLTLPLHITPRIAYFASGATAMAGASHLGLDPLNIAPGMSKGYLYAPQNFLDGFARVSGFTLGVDGLAFEEQLRAAFWATFLSSSAESAGGGLEIGLRVGFCIK